MAHLLQEDSELFSFGMSDMEHYFSKWTSKRKNNGFFNLKSTRKKCDNFNLQEWNLMKIDSVLYRIDHSINYDHIRWGLRTKAEKGPKHPKFRAHFGTVSSELSHLTWARFTTTPLTTFSRNRISQYFNVHVRRKHLQSRSSFRCMDSIGGGERVLGTVLRASPVSYLRSPRNLPFSIIGWRKRNWGSDSNTQHPISATEISCSARKTIFLRHLWTRIPEKVGYEDTRTNSHEWEALQLLPSELQQSIRTIIERQGTRKKCPQDDDPQEKAQT